MTVNNNQPTGNTAPQAVDASLFTTPTFTTPAQRMGVAVYLARAIMEYKVAGNKMISVYDLLRYMRAKTGGRPKMDLVTECLEILIEKGAVRFQDINTNVTNPDMTQANVRFRNYGISKNGWEHLKVHAGITPPVWKDPRFAYDPNHNPYADMPKIKDLFPRQSGIAPFGTLPTTPIRDLGEL